MCWLVALEVHGWVQVFDAVGWDIKWLLLLLMRASLRVVQEIEVTVSEWLCCVLPPSFSAQAATSCKLNWAFLVKRMRQTLTTSFYIRTSDRIPSLFAHFPSEPLKLDYKRLIYFLQILFFFFLNRTQANLTLWGPHCFSWFWKWIWWHDCTAREASESEMYTYKLSMLTHWLLPHSLSV